MNIQKIDGLNIILILISLFLAYQLPFGLFLFSYAVLGPLHYLTEINWLKQKNYFIKEGKWIWVLILLSFLATILIVLKLKTFHLTDRPAQLTFALSSNDIFNLILLLSLIFAAGLVYLKNTKHLVLFLLVAALLSYLLLRYASFSTRLLCLFLPTIVHVYLFTLLFMVAGAINTKSVTGIIAVVLLTLCPFIICLSNINMGDYKITQLTKTTFIQSGFYTINERMANISGWASKGHSLFLSVIGIKVQVFIAFCYTYHYLNWFSKTSVIGWGKNISMLKLSGIIIIWIASVLLYWYNYKIGFMALSFLSMLHVMLEFPLNITSVKQIFSKIRAKKTLQPNGN